MSSKSNIWYFVALVIAIVTSIMAFVFLKEFQRGAYMLNFIVLGYIVKRLIEIKTSINHPSRKKILNRRILFFSLFCFAAIGFLSFGFNFSSYLFSISLTCGLLGLIILIYIRVSMK